MTRVLYLVHDLDDAAVWRRVEMLRRAGAEVDLSGFRRGDGPLPGPAQVLGKTRNARMAERALTVLRQRVAPDTWFSTVPRPDAILARNLEMLALAVPLRRRLAGGKPLPLAYEVLDIHRLMVGDSLKARTLRALERRLCREVDRLIVSSPAFEREHFEAHGQYRGPVTLVENKVMGLKPRPVAAREAGGPIRIGWFGILRCETSLGILDAVTRARPGHFRVMLRGRPALDAVPRFHEVVASNPDLEFGGPYTYPDDLPAIYGAVDLAWLVDRYDAGTNSDWLLPNRLYESGLNGVPPIGLAGTQVARRMQELGIGLELADASADAATAALEGLTDGRLDDLRKAQAQVPTNTWITRDDDCTELQADLLGPARPQHAAPAPGVLIVVPTLQEEAHVGGVIDGLVPALRELGARGIPARLVVADGGSTDRTLQIVTASKSRHADVRIDLLDNPLRLQSAAVNLAVSRHGEGMGWLVRIDAHAVYPPDYVQTLLDEAVATQADSVVVAMRAIGTSTLQEAFAIAQNSRIGNGGAAHRTGGPGRWVDHGHHALMRLDAFRAVGGYDETFSHNEDAELDLRLRRAGYRVWLTTRTGLDYVPRRSIAPLMRQYWNFGRGRARTVLKHRLRPRLRQLAMIGVAPAAAAALLGPMHAAFAVPAAIWAGLCLAGGVMLALSQRRALALAAGPVACAMHLSWSAGFWRQVLAGPPAVAPANPLTPVQVPSGPVAVGICTFRRPGLIDTLVTLEAQELPPGVTATIIVADNDREPTARAAVETFAATSRHQVAYVHAPAANISVARNAVLDEAVRRDLRRLAFIDDDELAPAHWLAALLERLAQGDTEVVVGPVHATYPERSPGWMRRTRVHDTLPELGHDGRPIAGHSCNVLMDLSAPALAGRRFDLARGVSGGEDTAFFDGARRAGARLAFAARATLDEPVSPSRARLGWLLRRRFRMGQTHGSLLRERAGALLRLRDLGVATAKVAYCAVGALLTSPLAGQRNRNLLRGALHAGTAAALVGMAPVEIYGDMRDAKQQP